MEGKWLIADRDLNEREGLKWLLKSSSIPVIEVNLAADFQEFMMMFEQEPPDIIFFELDMIPNESWNDFRELVHIYQPVLLLSSTEATFEKARLAIELQALELMIKPFSTTKVKSAFQKASRKLDKRNQYGAHGFHSPSLKDISYESFFLGNSSDTDYSLVAAFQTEDPKKVCLLHSFLSDYPFVQDQGLFALNDMVIQLFKETCGNVKEQCQKAMRKWEEEFTDPIAVVVHKGKEISLQKKYFETRKMLGLTYYHGYLQVAEFTHFPEFIHIDPFLDPPEQRVWIDCLTNLDGKQIKTLLYNEFLQMEEPFPDPGLIRIRLTSILAQIRRYMKTYSLHEDQVLEKEYRYIFNSILYDTVLYRTVQNLILFVQRIFEGVEQSVKGKKQDTVERGISYMEAHFGDSTLRLEDVAGYVERNPSYFSHLLVSKLGVPFTEVLSGIRIKEAKRLLIETNKPIKEIALLVGFQNPNYFSRMFKEEAGLTPKEYRIHKTSVEK